MRIGILVSHPIQYYTPLFRALAERTDLHVFYATKGSRVQQAKAGFGVEFEWDLDLLSGYSHSFLTNVSANPGPSRFRGCDTPGIAEEINEGNFDAFVVFGWYLKSHWQAIRACRRGKIPVLVRGDSQLRGRRSTLRSVAKEITHRFALRQFDGFLAVGQRNREYLLHYGIPEKRIFFSPHFVDNEWFAERAALARSQRSEIRRQLGIPEDAFCVIFVGKFLPNKRPIDLVRAAELLITNNRVTNNGTPRLHLLFVGSGELGPELRTSCNVVYDAELAQMSEMRTQRSGVDNPLPTNNQQQLTDNGKPLASFAGFKNQSELPACYVAAEVLVLSSESETWGLVVNEAMACGLPAIVSDTAGCAPEMIEEARTGYVYPMGDTIALSSCFEKAATLTNTYSVLIERLEGKLTTHSVDAAAKGLLQAVSTLSKAR